jgi:hypothetical protein
VDNSKQQIFLKLYVVFVCGNTNSKGSICKGLSKWYIYIYIYIYYDDRRKSRVYIRNEWTKKGNMSTSKGQDSIRTERDRPQR